MMPSAFFLFLIGLYLLHLRLVSGKLWPTKPVAGTEYTIGRCDEILWIDDGKLPSMQDMGPVTIDLYFGNETYIATVGDYDSIAGSAMFCPPFDLSWPASMEHFYFRFTGDHRTVYTHPFGIRYIQANQTEGSYSGSGNPTTLYVSPSSSSVQSISTPTSINLQRQEPGSATTVYAEPLSAGNAALNRAHQSNNARSNIKLKLDLKLFSSWSSKKAGLNREKIKFHLVFIVWPALVGISMAL